MIGGMTGVLKDVIPFGLSFGNRNFLKGINIIGLKIQRGDILDNIRLQNNDVISIPIKNSEIEIEGMVTQPGIFELKKDETLGDLIYFAGGLRFNADNKANIKNVARRYRICQKWLKNENNKMKSENNENGKLKNKENKWSQEK